MIYEARFIDDQPSFKVPLSEILSGLKPGGALEVLSPLEYHTARQRRWYKGVCLPWLVKHDENKESIGWWDDEVKRLCKGLELLKKEVYFIESVKGQKIPIGRLTTKGVGKKKMTAFIEEILAKSVEMNWGVAAPAPELRAA